MVDSVMIWNEPNNLSHWDFETDPGWEIFSRMAREASLAVASESPRLTRVLGGISPIDPEFIRRMERQGVLDAVDAVAVHGFPLDWNHWSIHEWPDRLDAIRAATTRHREAEGSSYYRHFYMGLLREDGTPKLALREFERHAPDFGICQWIHFEDPRLDDIAAWLKRLGVRHLRTGMSWADSLLPGALPWFDRQMRALEEFDVTLTYCFTPESCGVKPDHTSPPRRVEAFAEFCAAMTRRYAR